MKSGGTAVRDCDVLVIGAGPAGSSAAAAAAGTGGHVIMIDRRRRTGLPPRCAGFVPMQLFHAIGMDRGVAAQRVGRMVTHYPYGIEESRAFGYIVHRDLFDRRLAERARNAGTVLLTGHRARTRTTEGVLVERDEGPLRIRASVVIGADGPLSTAGRWIGARNVALVRAAQWRLRLTAPLAAAHFFFSQDIYGGYGWLFPRGEQAVAGVAVAAGSNERSGATLRRLVDRLVAEGMVKPEILDVTGGLIPVGGPISCRGGNVLLAGDAAGHCHPVTGAGIATAVLCGELAGEAAAAYAKDGDESHLRDYEAEIEETFMDSLRHGAAKRKELMASWYSDDGRFSAALRRGWFVFPEYARR